MPGFRELTQPEFGVGWFSEKWLTHERTIRRDVWNSIATPVGDEYPNVRSGRVFQSIAGAIAEDWYSTPATYLNLDVEALLEERPWLLSVVKADVEPPSRVGVRDIVRLFIERSRKTPAAQDQEEWTNSLERQATALQLMGVLIENDWLGLHLLDYLHELGPSSASSLAIATSTSCDLVAPLLALLVQGHVVEVEEGAFVLASIGVEILGNLETALSS